MKYGITDTQSLEPILKFRQDFTSVEIKLLSRFPSKVRRNPDQAERYDLPHDGSRGQERRWERAT